MQHGGGTGRGPWARAALAGAVAAVLATAACGQQDEDPPTGTTSGPTTPSPDVPTTSGQVTETPGGDTGTATSGGPTETSTPTDAGTEGPTETATETATSTVEPTEPAEDFLAPGEVATGELTGDPDLLVTDVRLGAHEGFDRVVLDLEGSGVPGWRVRYEDNPALDGSGAPVDLAGTHTLVVTVTGTRYPEEGEDAYDPGQLLVRADGLDVVTEVLRVAPFEGQLDVFVGTRGEAPFRAFTLQNPTRLVVDVARG